MSSSCLPLNFVMLIHRYIGNIRKAGQLCLGRRFVLNSVNQRKLWLHPKPIKLVCQEKYLENSFSLLENARFSSNSNKDVPKNLDSLFKYENVTEETLESLVDKFEEVLQDSSLEEWDVDYSNGVMTVMIDKNNTYVINKQTPNRQIWLSSPISGPKRYDYVDGSWIYKHDGVCLHELLTKEITDKLQKEANFLVCSYGK